MNYKIIKFVVLFFLLFGGIGLVYHASKFSEFIIPKDYIFEFQSYSADDGTLNMTAFLLTYDFPQEIGNITFFPSNNSLIYLQIRFPSFILDKTTDITFYKCKTYADNCIKSTDIKFDRELIKTPDYSPYFTTLRLSNFSRGFYPYEKVNIKFKTDIKPSGTFIITQHKANIKQANYALNFILGNDFEPLYKDFIEPIQGIKIYNREGINERDIKLEFEESFHSFRIKAISKSNIFWSTFLLGLGSSLIGSAIVVFFWEFLPILFNNNKNKKLKILYELLNGQRKIIGIGKRTLEKLKKEFNKL